MSINYYLAIFPVESLVASQLPAREFGTYMSIGSRKGSNENYIFAEIKGECLRFINPNSMAVIAICDFTA